MIWFFLSPQTQREGSLKSPEIKNQFDIQAGLWVNIPSVTRVCTVVFLRQLTSRQVSDLSERPQRVTLVKLVHKLQSQTHESQTGLSASQWMSLFHPSNDPDLHPVQTAYTTSPDLQSACSHDGRLEWTRRDFQGGLSSSCCTRRLWVRTDTKCSIL